MQGDLDAVFRSDSLRLRLVLLLWERISERAMLAVERCFGAGAKGESQISGSDLERIM
jgi:hypothetical protein